MDHQTLNGLCECIWGAARQPFKSRGVLPCVAHGDRLSVLIQIHATNLLQIHRSLLRDA